MSTKPAAPLVPPGPNFNARLYARLFWNEMFRRHHRTTAGSTSLSSNGERVAAITHDVVVDLNIANRAPRYTRDHL